MAFGKRTAGEPPRRPPEPELAPEAPESAAIGTVRTRVTNHGDIDRKFIGIAVGVVVLSAGGALAGPSLLSMMSATSVRPVEQVIAGLDRAGVRSALAHEAFPDESGRAFMTSLATHFPQQHGKLLDMLADTAAAGGDRDDLLTSMNGWSMSFAPEQMAALSRTGAEGFDQALGILTDALKVVEAKAGGCTINTLERYLRDPSTLADLSRYGGEGYQLGMRAGQVMVELAAKGRKAQPINTQMTPDDENALRSTFLSMLSDPQVMNLVQAGMGGPNMQVDMQQNLNVCQLARTVIIKLEGLPSGTKARMFATALSGNIDMMNGSFSNPFGPQSFQGMQPGPVGFLP